VSKRRYQGMLQILRYNWPAYAAALVTTVSLVTVGFVVPAWTAAWMAAALISVGALWTLAAAHLVYDCSSLYRFAWLPRRADSWASLHGGLDAATPRLAERFPEAFGISIDLWSPQTMPGRSARRARKDAARGVVPASPDSLPLAAASQDIMVLTFFAHELDESDRIALFGEVRRTLSPTGRAYLVEHLRDAANLAAFGPGAFHFLPRRTWNRNIMQGGLRVKSVTRVAVLVTVWSLEAA
jgi:hypothetical protein